MECGRNFLSPSETHEYQAMIHWLFQRSRGLGVHFGLDRMKAVLTDYLKSPHLTYPTIHIAGTNGKGSVSTKIAKALELKGYKVGLYTSPHIQSVCERIRINGTPISPSRFLQIYRKLRRDIPIEQLELTFFEIVTLLAFQAFFEERVDIAVIETGLGGRLDATNVVKPLLSVITSIGLDHTEQLGATIEAITQEKAGIIKPYTPLVIGPTVPKSQLVELCAQKMAPIYSISKSCINFDQENNAVVRQALSLLPDSFRPNESCIETACLYRPPCRFEEVPYDVVTKSHFAKTHTEFFPFPRIFLDVAHNPNGIERLCEMLEEAVPGKRAVIVFSASREKKVQEMVRLLSKKASYVIFPSVRHVPRLSSPEELYTQSLELGISKEKLIREESIDSALLCGISLAKQLSEPVLITGSFFLMADIRRLLGYEEFTDPIFSNEASLSSGSKSI